MGLIFDALKHEYKLNGVVIPSVTQVLHEAGLIDLSFVDKGTLEYKSDIGSKVHKTTELYDFDDLDEEKLHPLLQGYLAGWKKFRADYNFVPVHIELMLYHPIYRYAGRIDRIGNMGSDIVQLDIKSGIKKPVYAIQSSAYTELYNYGKPKSEQIKRRFTVYLSEDGTYKVDEYKNKTDLNIFLASLTITNYKRSQK